MEKATSHLEYASKQIGGDTVFDFGCVTTCTEKTVCKWKVMNYSKWPQNDFEIASPTFRSSESIEWCLVLSNTTNAMLYLYFNLLSSNINPMIKATVRVSMISEYGNKYEILPETAVNLEKAQKVCKILLNDFFEKEDGPMDTIRIEGEVRMTSVRAEAGARGEAAGHKPRSVADALGALLASGDLADLVLVAGDSKFRAHRAVLSARSPVFAAMLRPETAEARTGVVEVPGVDAAALAELLRHVYTGRAACGDGLAARLLAAADRYALPDLRDACEEQLARELAVPNAVATAELALGHGGPLLRAAAVAFIAGHIFPVLGSAGWAEALLRRPGNVAEICRQLAERADQSNDPAEA